SIFIDIPIPFDFLIDNNFLRTSLKEYLDTNNLSTENIIEIEYVKSAIPPKTDSKFPHDDWVSSVHISRSKDLICTSSFDGFVRVWSTENKCLATLEGHEAAVKSVKFLKESNDILTLVSASLDETLLVWEFTPSKSTYSQLYRCTGHDGSVESVSVSRDSKV
ncbi:WD repeat-containing protein 12, partial [Nowakowskiella sp. JEL0078]